MKIRRMGIPILVGLMLCLAPHDAYGGASDTWAQHRKVLTGQFNNWTPQSMTGPDSNGLHRVEVKLFPGTWQYKFGVVLNGTDTQIEPNFSTSSGNREVTVPFGADTFYAPGNWADTPPKPASVTTSIVGVGQIKLTWTEATPGGLDVIHGGGFHVYYRAGTAPGPPWTQADTGLLTATTYTVSALTLDTVYHFVVTAVDAYDAPGVPSTDSPAPPGPLTDTSSVVTDTPQGKILVQFIVDMRKEISAAGRPKFGVGVGGSLKPLTWQAFRQPLKEIQDGIWSESYEIQAGQNLEYKYVKNPGTSKQEWEGQTDQFPVLFRFDPATLGLSAANVSAVYVRGDFNGFSDKSDWKMSLESDSVFRLVKSTRGTQKYKYFVYHSGATTGEWIPGGDNLSITVSDIPTLFTYGPDTSAVAVYVVGNFHPWVNNDWTSASRVDDFYKLTPDNRKIWRLTRNMPEGTHAYKFIIDATNDNVKNGDWEIGNDRYLNVPGNRFVTVASNYGSGRMRIVDVWEQAGAAPPRTPISITAISMDTKVLLSWRPSKEFIVNAYNVYRDTSKTGTFPAIATVAAAAFPEYTDTNVTNGTTYYYKITALDTASFLESRYSAVQEAVPAGGNAMLRRAADGQDSYVTVEIPGGSLPAGAYMQIMSLIEAFDEKSTDTQISDMMDIVSAANTAMSIDPLQWTLSENSAADSDPLIYMVDFKYKTTGADVQLADKPIRITIPITDTHQAYSKTGGLAVAGYALYVLNETTRRWEIVAGSKTSSSSAMSVSAPRYSFSIFQVMALAGAVNNLDGMVVYPNPVYPNRDFSQRGDPYGTGQAGATFLNVPTDVEFITIYTITGEIVRTLDPADPREYVSTGTAARMIWDLNNNHGRPVASGVYLFFAKSATSKRTGKVAVVR